MIVPFPTRKKPPAPLAEPLVLHRPQDGQEHDLEWAHWMFQGVRARCEGITFKTRGLHRAQVLLDWERHMEETFLPILAPCLLAAWKGAGLGDAQSLGDGNAALNRQLPRGLAMMSLEAGEVLLRDTRGAKYQGVLGSFRDCADAGAVAPHLAMVWAGLSAMFQMPPQDFLSEYLREEWLVGTRDLGPMSPPQGGLSFVGLAQRAMHKSQDLFAVSLEESRREA